MPEQDYNTETFYEPLFALKPALNSALVGSYVGVNGVSLAAYRQSTQELASFLKLHSSFVVESAIDCFAVDTVDAEFRFLVVYTLQSSIGNFNFTIATRTNELFALISLQNIFPAFNWSEREVWDLTGVMFLKHPDLRRILTDYGFVGHPLRKDFPLTGFREVHYEDSTKHIEYEPVELPQNFRLFAALSPWQDLDA